MPTFYKSSSFYVIDNVSYRFACVINFRKTTKVVYFSFTHLRVS